MRVGACGCVEHEQRSRTHKCPIRASLKTTTPERSGARHRHRPFFARLRRVLRPEPHHGADVLQDHQLEVDEQDLTSVRGGLVLGPPATTSATISRPVPARRHCFDLLGRRKEAAARPLPSIFELRTLRDGPAASGPARAGGPAFSRRTTTRLGIRVPSTSSSCPCAL